MDKMIQLCLVKDKAQAEMIIDILKQNGIAVYREGEGSAGIMDSYASNSTFGEKIIINPKDIEKAQELAQPFLENENIPSEYQ